MAYDEVLPKNYVDKGFATHCEVIEEIPLTEHVIATDCFEIKTTRYLIELFAYKCYAAKHFELNVK